jgi:hypothetical protein
VAALWLSFHGWTALERRYGAANIAGVFKALLQQMCRTPRGWDTRNFGPGIVDAAALLSAPLPERVRARKLRDARRAAVATDTTSLETIVHLLPEAPRTGIERVLAETLHVSDRDLPHVLQDVGDELAFQLVMVPALRRELEQRARRPSGRRTTRRETVTIAFDRRQASTRLAARMASRQPRRG